MSLTDKPDPLEQQVTQMMTAIQKGDRVSSEELLPLVYSQLRKLAQARLNSEPQEYTLQATALVHEAYLRVSDGGEASWNSKGHFFAAAAEAMRRIVIDNVRARRAVKRGGDLQRIEFEGLEIPNAPRDEELLEIHEHLDELAKINADAAELVKLRFFVGLTLPEACEALGITTRTASRRFAYARAWLYDRIQLE